MDLKSRFDACEYNVLFQIIMFMVLLRLVMLLCSLSMAPTMEILHDYKKDVTKLAGNGSLKLVNNNRLLNMLTYLNNVLFQ